MTFEGVKAVGEDAGGTGSKREEGFARFGGVGRAGRELEWGECECEADKAEQCARLNESSKSFHHTSGVRAFAVLRGTPFVEFPRGQMAQEPP